MSGNYRPDFLDHFDQKDKASAVQSEGASSKPTTEDVQNETDINSPAGQALQKQLQQIAGGQPVLQNMASSSANTSNPSKFQQCIAEGDLEFVSLLKTYFPEFL